MPNLTTEQLAILRLLMNIEGIGSFRIRQLYSQYKSFENILSAGFDSLIRVQSINQILAKKITSASASGPNNYIPEIIKEQEKLNKTGSRMVTYWDDDYPFKLRNIYDPPLSLYIKGSLKESDLQGIAVVGTRTPTQYGKNQAERFSESLARNGITIISGMARGIDSIAHKTALKYGSGTVAVIGSGLDVIYPPENRDLFNEIAKHGAVITEYELGTSPDAANFPKRNRIIAGLASGVLVVESAKTGGALQTAAYAFDCNTDVFAVPGNVGSLKSEGTNSLIKKNIAKLVTSAEEILQEMEIRIKPEMKKENPAEEIPLNFFEEKLLQCINEEPAHIDQIAAQSSMQISDCMVNLLTLEFKGLIKQIPGKMFIKR
ncbi:MAG: DNA-processing protein DprA [Syntrophothermus sp.]